MNEILTIADLEKDKNSSSVWVLNNSNPKGNINLTMNDGMGAQMVIRVPVTFIPMDLSTQASKQALLASPTFRRLVAMGMFKLISDKDATERMSKPEAQKEATRIYNMVQELTLDQSVVPQEVITVQQESSGQVSPFAMNLAIASGLDEEQVMTTLMGNESAMAKADFQYLAEKSEFTRVKAFAAERIISMT